MTDGDGNAVLEGGNPVVTYGPQHHIDSSLWERYRLLRRGVSGLTELVSQLEPLREHSGAKPPGPSVQTVPVATAPAGGAPRSPARSIQLYPEFEE